MRLVRSFNKKNQESKEEVFSRYFWHFMGNFQFQFHSSLRFDEKIS